MSQTVICRKNFATPFGEMTAASRGDALVEFDWVEGWHCGSAVSRLRRLCPHREVPEASPVIEAAIAQLQEYLEKKRRKFDVKVEFIGSPFQRKVWEALLEIPYGETISYGELAERIGNPKGVRAVANAVGANPLSIIVPCHRIIGGDGSITGYGGGLEAKRGLLALEGIEI